MAEPTVDVLAVLGRYEDEAHRELRAADAKLESGERHDITSADYEFLKESVREACEVRAALAELIEADREYDDARKAYAASVIPSVCRAQAARITAAEQRRAAALARIGTLP